MLAHVSNFPVGQDRRGRGTGAARSADPRPESGNPSGTPQPTIPLALGKARPAKASLPKPGGGLRLPTRLLSTWAAGEAKSATGNG
jgi:hypothetical protein